MDGWWRIKIVVVHAMWPSGIRNTRLSSLRPKLFSVEGKKRDERNTKKKEIVAPRP